MRDQVILPGTNLVRSECAHWVSMLSFSGVTTERACVSHSCPRKPWDLRKGSIMAQNYVKNWLSRILSWESVRSEHRSPRRPRRSALRIEELEDRITPAPIPM